MSEITLQLNQGEVSSRDPAALNDGELKRSVGSEYLPGDTERIWKIRGRTDFGATGSSTEVRGLALCKFDSGGLDKLIALTSSSIFSASPGESGDFTSLTGGRSVVSKHLSAAHYNDRWYLTTGIDRNSVLENDGTFRDMGMKAPPSAPSVAAVASSANTLRPTTGTSTTTDGQAGDANSLDLAYDADEETFGGLAAELPVTVVATFAGWASNNDANRRMVIRWSFTGSAGGKASADQGGFRATINFEKSEDQGLTWETFYTEIKGSLDEELTELQVPVDDLGTTVNNTDVQFRATIQYNSGTSLVVLRIYDIRIQDGSDATPFDATALIYAVSEFDSVRGLRSPLTPVSKAVAVSASSSENQVDVTLPASQNSTSTHWIIYRTPDNGIAPRQLGQIGQISITSSIFEDHFELFPADTQPTPIAPLKSILSDDSVEVGAEVVFDRDTPPPLLTHITAYAGRLVGVAGRSLFYSEPGFPESWPTVNVISSLPMPDRDELLSAVQVGESLLIGATEVMLALDTLPDIIGNRLVATPPRPLSGQPGLAGLKALVSFSVAGEARAAWVSRFGIHMTNTTLTDWLTKDVDWLSKVKQSALDTSVLAWDRNRQCLVFAYTRPDDERRWALIHMAPEHRKSNRMPKITWDHYGKFSSVVAGEVDGVYRVYSGHLSDGKVYLEDSGDEDKSNAYDNSGTIPFGVDPGDQYAKWSEFGVNRGNVRHGDVGSEQSLSVGVVLSRDSSGNSQAVTKTVSLGGDKGTEFLVNRAGEKLSMSLDHSGKARISLRDVRLDVEPMGNAGKVR